MAIMTDNAARVQSFTPDQRESYLRGFAKAILSPSHAHEVSDADCPAEPDDRVEYTEADARHWSEATRDACPEPNDGPFDLSAWLDGGACGTDEAPELDQDEENWEEYDRWARAIERDVTADWPEGWEEVYTFEQACRASAVR